MGDSITQNTDSCSCGKWISRLRGVFQALLMNPLADSYTMGFLRGCFGATLAIYFNLFIWEYNISITIFAFLGLS